jgi:hypothetical protein
MFPAKLCKHTPTCALRQQHAITGTTSTSFFEGPRRRCYGRTAALRLIVQP